MPQLSLYIDRDTLNKVEKIAKRDHLSISKWVGKSIRSFLDNEFPEDYFSLFGSIDDPSFNEPKPVNFSHDSKREAI